MSQPKSPLFSVCARTCRSPGGDLGAKRKKKKQKRKKEKPSSGGAKSDSASDSQEFKVRNDGYFYNVFQPEQPSDTK